MKPNALYQLYADHIDAIQKPFEVVDIDDGREKLSDQELDSLREHNVRISGLLMPCYDYMPLGLANKYHQQVGIIRYIFSRN